VPLLSVTFTTYVVQTVKLSVYFSLQICSDSVIYQQCYGFDKSYRPRTRTSSRIGYICPISLISEAPYIPFSKIKFTQRQLRGNADDRAILDSHRPAQCFIPQQSGQLHVVGSRNFSRRSCVTYCKLRFLPSFLL